MRKTISISEELHAVLTSRKRYKMETFEEVLKRIIQENHDLRHELTSYKGSRGASQQNNIGEKNAIKKQEERH